jgi:hypothetical protein
MQYRVVSTLRLTLIPVLLMGCSGCTFATKGTPRRVKTLESRLISNGNEFGSSHGVFMHSILGITISGSFSHIPGTGDRAIQPSGAYKLGSQANAPDLEIRTYEGGCPVDAGMANQLRSLTDAVFQPVNNGYDWKKITMRIDLVPSNTEVDRKIYSVNIKHYVTIRLYFSCNLKTAKRDIFNSYLTSMHEISHVMDDLKGNDVEGNDHGVHRYEILAEGGPACVYQHLRTDGDPLMLRKTLNEITYFNASWETAAVPHSERRKWCANWISYFE